MSEQILLPWTPLAPSRLARRLVYAACMLAFCAALALSIAAALQSDALRVAVALFACAVAGVCVWRVLHATRHRSEQIELSLTDGEIWVRSVASVDRTKTARPLFVNPLLIALRHDAGATIVWSDALPAAGYRRLSAACRWHLARDRQRDRRGQGRAKDPSAQTAESV